VFVTVGHLPSTRCGSSGARGCVERRGGGHPNQKGFSIEQQVLAMTDFGKFL